MHQFILTEANIYEHYPTDFKNIVGRMIANQPTDRMKLETVEDLLKKIPKGLNWFRRETNSMYNLISVNCMKTFIVRCLQINLGATRAESVQSDVEDMSTGP